MELKIISTRLDSWYNWYLSEQGAVHYAIHSSLYINTVMEKYIKLCTQLTHRL